MFMKNCEYTLARQSQQLGLIEENWTGASTVPPGDCLQLFWFDILDIVCSTTCYEWMNEENGTDLGTFQEEATTSSSYEDL